MAQKLDTSLWFSKPFMASSTKGIRDALARLRDYGN